MLLITGTALMIGCLGNNYSGVSSNVCCAIFHDATLSQYSVDALNEYMLEYPEHSGAIIRDKLRMGDNIAVYKEICK